MSSKSFFSILIVQNSLVNHTGEELYTSEIARELQKHGYNVIIYAQRVGLLAQNLKKSGIQVFTRLKDIPKPDVIHGHCLFRTAEALDYFTNTPAVFVCHNHTNNSSLPPRSGRVLQTFGVSQVCCDFLLKAGIEQTRVQLLENFVDIQRFAQRSELPKIPTRAAVFSNYATWDGYLPAIKEACNAEGLSLEVIGSGVGNKKLNPELELPQYDIVFAKARAAIEAMAVGNAVILCDFAGVGEMVSTQNYERLKPLNFGFAALTKPHDVAVIRHEIQQYSPFESVSVSHRIRQEANLEAYISKLEKIYLNATTTKIKTSKKQLYTWRLRLLNKVINCWFEIPEARRIKLKHLFQYPIRMAKRVVYQKIFSWNARP
jgi:Glycosyltransferase Family 4